jgi:hypothetical protein
MTDAEKMELADAQTQLDRLIAYVLHNYASATTGHDRTKFERDLSSIGAGLRAEIAALPSAQEKTVAERCAIDAAYETLPPAQPSSDMTSEALALDVLERLQKICERYGCEPGTNRLDWIDEMLAHRERLAARAHAARAPLDVRKILHDHFYTGEPGQHGAIEAALTALSRHSATPRDPVTFGLGLYGVDIGTSGGKPAVFIIPNEKPGPVGEKIPLELQGPLERDEAPDDWIVLLFPTRERCKEVADALVGSKMDRWSGDGDATVTRPDGGKPKSSD